MDFVYFDPPYYKLGGYSDFNRYTPEQFKEAERAQGLAVNQRRYAGTGSAAVLAVAFTLLALAALL